LDQAFVEQSHESFVTARVGNKDIGHVCVDQ
jgi:hypothetical protein